MENIQEIEKHAIQLLIDDKPDEMIAYLRKAFEENPQIVISGKWRQIADGRIGQFLMLDSLSDKPKLKP